MKILLVQVGTQYTRDGKIIDEPIIVEHSLPLGILYLGQVLEQENYEVEYFDHAVADISVDKLSKWIVKNDFNIVGLTVLTATFITAVKIAQKLKSLNKNIIVVFGGPQATICHDKIMEKYKSVDFCVRNDGEYTFLNLIKHIESNKPVSDVRGITYRENGKVKYTENAGLIDDLDKLSFPDRKVLTDKHKYMMSGLISPIITTRGCPYNCKFCTCHIIYKRRVRFRSVRNVVDELIYLESEGFKEIMIVDDCFTLKPKRVEKICELIKKENIDLKWHSLARTNLGGLNMYRQMATAGCTTVLFGFESATQRILDYYNKQITPDLAIKSIKKVRKANIPNISGGFIIGAPTETFKEIVNTIKFGLKLNISILQFQILNITPGTLIYKEFIEKGWINDETDWEGSIPAPDICPTAVPKKILNKLIENATKRLLTNPRRIFRDYYNFIRNEYQSRYIRGLLKSITNRI
ncbi:MAG: radical SAM protein [Candidatus Lokiarchaeota archaeon]|nr:radical SAM protein [Candidatus Lokiarchaeota archaeon]